MDQDKILDYLVYNHSHLLNEVKSLVERKSYLYRAEHMVFHDDLELQYKANLRSIIVNDITKNLNVPIEDAIIVVESINLDRYLKGESNV